MTTKFFQKRNAKQYQKMPVTSTTFFKDNLEAYQDFRIIAVVFSRAIHWFKSSASDS